MRFWNILVEDVQSPLAVPDRVLPRLNSSEKLKILLLSKLNI